MMIFIKLKNVWCPDWDEWERRVLSFIWFNNIILFGNKINLLTFSVYLLGEDVREGAV